MDVELTIQQVAERTGLSVHTLRYYERNGLLEPVNRAANGHRRYCAVDITKIEFLTRLRATGMPIRQMQRFAILLRQNPAAVSDRLAILEAHEREVKQRIQELSRNLEIIRWKIQHYKELEISSQSDRACIESGVPQQQPPENEALTLT
ncbi:MerR family transcriptional regulator [Chroococcidiopsis sp. FACHB-1243]|uniref:MerR family transcriptional regulator n=1 Tax=Chroococcidiopsis sp. [FACHB-1243] TaxID=2692781 RepID=UPI00177E52B7|nr:MerR family transcriptional regulator [Chroococcidiopsis sp. [FACHB-1243]]MBD2304290.1 MerR family transcriptional regulator [Chroococcidiopsis sp. [FACHB-1243]]